MKKILIVDDIVTNRVLLNQTLQALGGYEVVEAINGNDAISLYEKEKPDLILMDIMMPDMDGREATTLIKAKMGDDFVPIIFVTALSSEDSLTTALAAGGDDFISKPFNVEVLASKINAHLRIRELTQQLNEKNNLLTSHNQHLTHEQNLIEYFFENAIKQSFLDKNIIQYHMSSMSAFNGDLLLVEQAPRGGLYMILGDFSGHGLSAAMGTLPVAMIFFKMVSESAAVGEIAHEINHQLHKLMPPGMFFTATLVEMSASCENISVWMGGMPENYCFNDSGDLKHIIHSQHMPLGILNDDDFDSAVQVFNICEKDKIYLYSDGVIEAKNLQGEQFGDERLKQALVSGKDARFKTILKELNEFTADENQNDDITLVELTCGRVPVKLENKSGHCQKYPLSWQTSVSLSVDDMRSADPVKNLTNILCAMPCVSRHKGVLYVLLFEIYANSLDHGILGIQSADKVNDKDFVEYYKRRDKALLGLEEASIHFDFSFYVESNESFIKIDVRDSGQGYSSKSIEKSDDLLHGRGLEIIRSLCETVIISEAGNALTILYKL